MNAPSISSVPDMRPAAGSPLMSGPPPGGTFLSSTIGEDAGYAPAFVATPPPAQTTADRSGKRQRVFGLVAAVAGSMHTIILRGPAPVRVDPREVSTTRAAKRAAIAEANRRQGALAASVTTEHPAGDVKALLACRDANDAVVALTRKLAEMEASNAARPVRVAMTTVREPAEAHDALASGQTRYVCLHDGCRRANPDGWADEDSMRREHPTAQEMARGQQTHVFALLSDAPLDALDPDGDRVGYIAPVGRDGTKVERLAAEAGFGGDDERDEKIAGLERALAEMRGLLDALTKGKPKA